MSYRVRLLLLSLVLVPMSPLPAMSDTPTKAPPSVAAYPKTERQAVVEDQFGVKVADPYRWLENDVRADPRVRAWVTAENEVTDAYLARLPARATFAQRIRQLFDYERYGVPVKKGGRYFYAKNEGLQNQAVLYVQIGRASCRERVLIGV